MKLKGLIKQTAGKFHLLYQWIEVEISSDNHPGLNLET